jgi:DNA-directed RNA polymerase specialized sigma24 family protein
MEPDKNAPQAPARTLGDVLYSSPSQARESEKNWVRLAQAVAAGERSALHPLYQRAHRPVFTLLMRLTSNRETAEELTVEIFDDLWRKAARYDPAKGTVLGWIMNQARAKAIGWLRLQQQEGAQPTAYSDLLKFTDQSKRMLAAIGTLTSEERAAIEGAFFAEQPANAARARIRSGLHKLRQALVPAGADAPATNPCERAELVCAHAIRALAASDVAAVQRHLSGCWQCRYELESLRPVVDAFVAWPTDVLRPPSSLQDRLARSVVGDAGATAAAPWSAPEWEDVAPGISCKLLATDTEKHVVSMLVRLAPGGEYPPHRHAGVEELHLLEGELWIDDRKLHAGDYNRAEPGTSDKRVWSETGCTCVLVTSTRDALG